MALRGAALMLSTAVLSAAGLSAAPALAQSTATSPALASALAFPAADEAPPADTSMPPAPLPAAPATPVAAALPGGAGVLDSATVQRIVDRLANLHLLASSADGEDPGLLAEAIRAFQSSVGISPTGMLDRDTIGRLTTP